MVKLNELSTPTKDVSTIAKIKEVTSSTTSTNKEFLSITLFNKTKTIQAKIWNCNEQDKEKIKTKSYILITSANLVEYQSKVQLIIRNYQIIKEEDLAKYKLTIDEFLKTSMLDTDKEYKYLISLINKFHNNVYRTITLKLFERYEQDFLNYPAGITVHHNVNGGLFWHSYTLVKNVLALKQNYSYAEIDWELLICGVILHDIGKIIEIIDVDGSDYSLEGKMLGHISIGNTQISKIADQLGFTTPDQNKYVTLLQHMILASHGKREYGSPVEPVIIEAYILSVLDGLDAKIFKINDELSQVNKDQWTQKIFFVDNKAFYKHK
ncbi:HD domain-containing protein [Mycoplasma putrefaciens]|uniref:3'-5' exoribonuclease YhaM family protein n=1 Tax=Mycoplasma putrefaciens TaxID=2123 RepID=UPI003DA6CBF8